MQGDPRRAVPPTDRLLADPRLGDGQARLGRQLVLAAVHAAQARVRAGTLDPTAVVEAVLATLPEHASTMHAVLNATGVVLHTNLGRASLSAAAREALTAAAGAVDVEYELDSGRRGGRGRGALAALRGALPLAGDVLVVNNGAAALLLAVTVLAQGREVLWSRGEMVEIGDGFRLPDLVACTGARVREVGTTNRTTVDDYRAALSPDTGCILKVHPSNFRVTGFTAAAAIEDLADLGVPVVADVGSGLLHPEPLLPTEPDISSALAAGASAVIASGDKLLGGPQAGLLAGHAELIARLRRHPMARALRVDKLTLAALEATLRGPRTPTWAALHAETAGLRARADALAAAVGPPATVVPSAGTVGGGGAPDVTLPGWAVALPEAYAARLRAGSPAVVGRLEHNRCLVDLRCVPQADDAVLAEAIRACR